MLSKRLCDILTILLVVLFIGNFVYGRYQMQESFDAFDTGEDMDTAFQGLVSGMAVQQLIYSIIGGIYWVFMIILAAQLYGKKLLSLLSLIIIILIPVFAPFYYILSLRGKLKQVESSNVPPMQPNQK